MILSELPQTTELIFYTKGDTFAICIICQTSSLFSTFSFISPVAFAREREVKGMAKSDYFYSFNQQIIQENGPQMVTQLSVKEGQWNLSER